MNVRAFISAMSIASLLTGMLPAQARAADDGRAPSPTQADIRGSIDRAASRLIVERSPFEAKSPSPRPNAALAQGPGGGGGGGGAGVRVLFMLIGTAASIGGTYYLVTQLKKQTDTAQK